MDCTGSVSFGVQARPTLDLHGANGATVGTSEGDAGWRTGVLQLDRDPVADLSTGRDDGLDAGLDHDADVLGSAEMRAELAVVANLVARGAGQGVGAVPQLECEHLCNLRSLAPAIPAGILQLAQGELQALSEVIDRLSLGRDDFHERVQGHLLLVAGSAVGRPGIACRGVVRHGVCPLCLARSQAASLWSGIASAPSRRIEPSYSMVNSVARSGRVPIRSACLARIRRPSVRSQ